MSHHSRATFQRPSSASTPSAIEIQSKDMLTSPSTERQTAQLVRVLADAFYSENLVKRLRQLMEAKSKAKSFKKLVQSDLLDEMRTLEPLDSARQVPDKPALRKYR